jgi:hypothetical protein
MIQHLEKRTLLTYPPGPEWNPENDRPKGQWVYSYEMGLPGGDFVKAGVTAAWSGNPSSRWEDGSPGATLTLSNVPAHSEIRILATGEHLRQFNQAADTTPDGAYILLNGADRATGNYDGTFAHVNSGLKGNRGGSNITVNVGPNNLEPGEDLIFSAVDVWIWTPEITLRHPPSLSEGQSGIVLVTRTGGDHGLYPVPVSLAKVEVFGLNQATNDDWSLGTSVTVPAGPPGTFESTAVHAFNDYTSEPEESAHYRVLPSAIHAAGGTPEAPTGNRTIIINPSGGNPYGGGGGGYQPQGALIDDPIGTLDDDNVDKLVDAVAGELIGEIVS